MWIITTFMIVIFTLTALWAGTLIMMKLFEFERPKSNKNSIAEESPYKPVMKYGPLEDCIVDIKLSNICKETSKRVEEIYWDFVDKDLTYGLSDTIKSQVHVLLMEDLPGLTKAAMKQMMFAKDSDKEAGRQAFLEGFERISVRYDELMQIQSQETTDAVRTKVNYLKNQHAIRKDDVFALPKQT